MLSTSISYGLLVHEALLLELTALHFRPAGWGTLEGISLDFVLFLLELEEFVFSQRFVRFVAIPVVFHQHLDEFCSAKFLFAHWVEDVL